MLSKSLAGAESMVQSLDTRGKLQFVRIYARQLNNIFYLKLEQNFLEHYEKVASNENIRSFASMDRDMLKKDNLIKVKLEKRQKKITNHLQLIENKLNQHKQQPSCMSRSMDMNRLSTILPAFVHQVQHKSSKDFERKKQLLQLDMHESRLTP